MAFGELSAVVLFWNARDHADGLAERCPECFGARGVIAEAYGQGDNSKCQACFGSSFAGLRGIYYRPAIWNPSPVSEDVGRRGEHEKIRAEIQMTSDLDIRDGDVIVRADGSRWRADSARWQEMTTGFQTTYDIADRVRSMISANLIDQTSPLYLPPVDLITLRATSGWDPAPLIPHPSDRTTPTAEDLRLWIYGGGSDSARQESIIGGTGDLDGLGMDDQVIFVEGGES